MTFRLSTRASNFLRESIRSVDELETILLLHRDTSRWWSAEQIADVLMMRAEVAARALECLAGRNLLDVRVGACLAYCCAPVHDHLFDVLSEVAVDPAAAREVVMLSSPKASRSLRG
jgi:hypothetical protein